MKRKLVTLAAVFFPLLAFSQTVVESTPSQTAGLLEEDSAEFESIADIIKEKEETTLRNDIIRHFNKVWSRRSYFNISYNSSTLVPQEDILTGVNNDIVQNCKSNLGLSLQYGRSFRLHKKPLGNVLQFYIDYTGIDLCFSHYKISGDGLNVYNSASQHEITEDGVADNYFYIPWNLEKYEGSFGMTIGPSLSVAPFNYTNSDGLHFLKLNMYFRVGYQASILYMVNKKEADMNTDINSYAYKTMKDNLKMNWGHGLMTCFGLSLTWKSIGIGYEHRVARNQYKSFSPSDFGSDTYKFKTSTDRIFLSIRLGR